VKRGGGIKQRLGFSWGLYLHKVAREYPNKKVGLLLINDSRNLLGVWI